MCTIIQCERVGRTLHEPGMRQQGNTVVDVREIGFENKGWMEVIKDHLQWQCCLQQFCQEVGYVFPLLKKAWIVVCVYLFPVTKIYQNLHLMYIFSANILDSEFFCGVS